MPALIALGRLRLSDGRLQDRRILRRRREATAARFSWASAIVGAGVVAPPAAKWAGVATTPPVSKSTARSGFEPSFIRAIFASGLVRSYLLSLAIQLDQIVDHRHRDAARFGARQSVADVVRDVSVDAADAASDRA
jgi:hypothetical protein